MNDTTGQSRLPCGFFSFCLEQSLALLRFFIYNFTISSMYLGTNQRRDYSLLWKINLINGKNTMIRKKEYMPNSHLEGHPNLSDPIHPFLPTLMPRKDWNRCKYILTTNIYIFAMKNRAQQQARAQSISYIPKWEYLPNWDCVIQTHPLQSTPPHPPWHADKGPIRVIKYPEPKYIFFPPKNAPRRAQKRETVSGHLRNVDYDASHVVDTCL